MATVVLRPKHSSSAGESKGRRTAHDVPKLRRRSSGRPEPSYRIRAIRREPLDARLLARLFIQMALEHAEAQHTHTSGTEAAYSDDQISTEPHPCYRLLLDPAVQQQALTWASLHQNAGTRPARTVAYQDERSSKCIRWS